MRKLHIPGPPEWFMSIVLTLALLAIAILSGAQDSQLTENESLKAANLQLQSELADALSSKSICEGQLGQYRSRVHQEVLVEQRGKLKADIEKAHPGFDYDPSTGALTAKPKAKP